MQQKPKICHEKNRYCPRPACAAPRCRASAAPLVTDAGRCGHRPLRSSIGEWRCRGRPPGRPAQPHTALLAKTCHCETSDRCHWLWQSALPQKAQRARFNPARCAELFIVKGNPVTSRCGCSAFPDSGKCWPPSCAAPWPRSSRSPSVKTRPCGPKSP